MKKALMYSVLAACFATGCSVESRTYSSTGPDGYYRGQSSGASFGVSPAYYYYGPSNAVYYVQPHPTYGYVYFGPGPIRAVPRYWHSYVRHNNYRPPPPRYNNWR